MFSFFTETFIKMTGETETIEKVEKIEETKKEETKKAEANLCHLNKKKQNRDCNTIKEVVMWTHM